MRLLACLLLLPALSFAQVPHTFSNGDVAGAEQINQNFNYVLENASGADQAALERQIAELQGSVENLSLTNAELLTRITAIENSLDTICETNDLRGSRLYIAAPSLSFPNSELEVGVYTFEADGILRYSYSLLSEGEPPSTGEVIAGPGVFAEIWTRDTLSMRDKRILLLGIIAEKGEKETFKIQIKASLKRGEMNADEARELFLFIEQYSGYPRAAAMLAPMEAAIAEVASEQSHETS